ncbi:Peptidyl-prolyl cis-trans isomerase FKBP53 [Morus notabilis]|uniref:peptidylprolyl isomerase n=1 Tax=Morus notabilis TaxID=981085 RepID=W9R2H0_9ROSA|nr:Peptidyl-prolyl cis-trans isomerase FKBP53 [Morus notabilis]
MWKADLPVEKLQTSDTGHKDGGTPKKKRKDRSTEGKSYESDGVKEDNTQQVVAKVDSNGLNLMAEDGEKHKMLNDSDLAHENDERPKKKRKKELKHQKKNVEVDNMSDAKENKDQLDGAKDASIVKDLSLSSEQNHKLANDQNKSEEKKVKKKKKKSKAQENGETVNTDTPPLPAEEKNTSSIDVESKKPDVNAAQVRTLQYGVVIEELEPGKPNGKVATSGKKISVRYVGKLDGEVVDSNIDSDPYKFRLGAGIVLEGWDVGLEVMGAKEMAKKYHRTRGWYTKLNCSKYVD